jgi:DNA-binding GntR family transcriptional regulator
VSTADTIARALRGEIRAGLLVPGQVVSQSELARRFGVSRIPVREALAQIAAEGHIIERRNRRPVVAELNTQRIDEILNIRQALETLATRKAVRLSTDDAIEKAREILRKITKSRGRSLIGKHEAFHSALFACADMPYTVDLINRHRLIDSRDADAQARGLHSFLKACSDVHIRLLEAFDNRDVAKALRCVREEIGLLRATHVPRSRN